MNEITLHDTAAMLGVSYTHLSRLWPKLGWIPIAIAGRQVYFSKRQVSEFYLSYKQRNQQSLRIRWLPWSTSDLAKVMNSEISEQPSSELYPPYYSAKHRITGIWCRRFSPPEIRKYCNDRRYSYNFLSGYADENAIAWDEYLQTAEGVEASRP